VNKGEPSVARLRDGMRAFRSNFNSIVLATISSEGTPDASSAPMVTGDAGEFYIYISGLSRHTSNLESNPKVGVLLIQQSQTAENAFARERLSYQCMATRIPRDSQTFVDILQRFSRQFGDIMDTLKNLQDFQLFCLEPLSGTYVRGFGQAWRLSGPGLDDLQHINPARDA